MRIPGAVVLVLAGMRPFVSALVPSAVTSRAPPRGGGGVAAPQKTATSRAATAVEEVPTSYADAIVAAKTVLTRAVATRSEPSDDVVAALLSLEKAARERARDTPESSEELLGKLDGSWRLCFTTGTIDTQKRTGRINYFPVKAVQSFDVETGRISNGIFLGDWAAVRFFGGFDFDLKSRKLEFDFDKIQLLGGLASFDIDSSDAASIGSATGLGSKNNENLVQKKKRPFFNWIDADDDIATARGGGGGLALWARTTPHATSPS